MDPIDARFRQLNDSYKAGELSQSELEAEKTKALAEWVNPESDVPEPFADPAETWRSAQALGLNLNTIPRLMALLMGLGMTAGTTGIANVGKKMMSIGATQPPSGWLHLITALEALLLLYVWYRFSRAIYRDMLLKRQPSVQDAEDPIVRHVMEPFDSNRRIRAAAWALFALWYALFRFSLQH